MSKDELTRAINKALRVKHPQIKRDGGKVTWVDNCCCAGEFIATFKRIKGDDGCNYWSFDDWSLKGCFQTYDENVSYLTQEFRDGKLTGKEYRKYLKGCEDDLENGHSPHINSFSQVDEYEDQIVYVMDNYTQGRQ